MALALYRRYRPQNLNQVVGQGPIVKTLQAALKHQKLSQAILLTGPRGVGKTTVARILAYEVNQIDYQLEGQHLDIVEIDAASNRRIEDVRELLARVNVVPIELKHKVYIIDEVHMLSKDSFNALLKTLEEPPDHIIFILATTEAHKVPITIVSRCQRFGFRLIDQATLVDQLKAITTKEKITIAKEALGLIASHSGGSLRDAISLLDQISLLPGKITVATVRSVLGLPPKQQLDALLVAIKDGNLSLTISTLRDLFYQGADALVLARQLIDRLRLDITNFDSIDQAVGWLDDLLDVQTSNQPEVLLEAILIKQVIHFQSPDKPKDNQPTTKTDRSTTRKAQEEVQPTSTTQSSSSKTKPTVATSSNVSTKPKQPAPQPPSPTNSPKRRLTQSDWDRVLKQASTKLTTVASILELAQVEIDDQGNLNLVFPNRFSANQFDAKTNPKNRHQLELILTNLKLICPKITIRVDPGIPQSKQSLFNTETNDQATDTQDQPVNLMEAINDSFDEVFGRG